MLESGHKLQWAEFGEEMSTPTATEQQFRCLFEAYTGTPVRMMEP